MIELNLKGKVKILTLEEYNFMFQKLEVLRRKKQELTEVIKSIKEIVCNDDNCASCEEIMELAVDTLEKMENEN